MALIAVAGAPAAPRARCFVILRWSAGTGGFALFRPRGARPGHLAFTEPPAITARIAASRSLHAAIAHAAAGIGTAAGLLVPQQLGTKMAPQ